MYTKIPVLLTHARHEISKKGLAISEVEPFITWNDGKPEIVLSRPDHIRQFYGRDTKGLGPKKTILSFEIELLTFKRPREATSHGYGSFF